MTLQERLRDPAHGFDRNDSHTEDRYVCLCEHLANEAADALDAKDARIKELEGALKFVQDDLENCDWSCERCGKDYEMKDTDIYLFVTRARAALKG